MRDRDPESIWVLSSQDFWSIRSCLANVGGLALQCSVILGTRLSSDHGGRLVSVGLGWSVVGEWDLVMAMGYWLVVSGFKSFFPSLFLMVIMNRSILTLQMGWNQYSNGIFEFGGQSTHKNRIESAIVWKCVFAPAGTIRPSHRVVSGIFRRWCRIQWIQCECR